MSDQFEFEPDAIADLEKLSLTVRDRILRKINWLATNFEAISPLGLTANLAGFYKLRLGASLCKPPPTTRPHTPRNSSYWEKLAGF
jgi:mRNA-degrading endonuclease RelE of RelBE toxin-antitoxin system